MGGKEELGKERELRLRKGLLGFPLGRGNKKRFLGGFFALLGGCALFLDGSLACMILLGWGGLGMGGLVYI